MLYPFYEMSHVALQPWRTVAKAGMSFWGNSANPFAQTHFGKVAEASLSMFERATRRFEKPSFNITDTMMRGKKIDVAETIAWQSPFCNLLHFKKTSKKPQTKLLLVAPMSGHFATLLRGTVEEMLPQYDVYVTDWMDARDVPVEAGKFDLDDYTDLIIDVLHHLGSRTHIMAVCQPSVPVLAAVALMSAKQDPLVPFSMALMGGPIDTRRSPTKVNELVHEKGLDWFKNNMVMKVAGPSKGVGRDVHAGFMQLTGFLAMNPERHMKAHRDLYRAKSEGDQAAEARHETFYDEYMAVMDMTAEFYLQTLDRVFVHHDLAHGTYAYRGVAVDPSLITQTALITIEGERDDISGLGQTEAAHEICSNIPAAKKRHHLQMGVGHYGVFSGSKFRSDIAPKMVEFFNAQEK
jgi:poly(3-hydroxybutyrate) depolymerase